MGRAFTVRGGPGTGFRHFKFAGGPFRQAPKYENTFNVCLLESKFGQTCDLWSPIPDFGVPPSYGAVQEHLKATLRAALDGKDVYVGCMGGKGRTGLFLALLLRCTGAYTGNLGGIGVIKYLRAVFDPHAVETEEQESYVNAFDVKPIQTWLFWSIFWRDTLALFSWPKWL